jgi:ubiquinone/menaquinone biosynthesis C-methylase UbiE
MFCHLCQSNKIKLLFLKHIWKNEKIYVYQCKNCKVAFTFPVLKDKDLQTIYSNDYPTYSPIFDSSFSIRERIERISRLKKVGRILDIGCGRGDFLVKMREKNWEVYGIDVSKSAIEMCRKKIENAYLGKLEDIKFKSNFFDVIILWSTLEHIRTPLQLFEEIRRILKVNGLIVIYTPNIESFNARFYREKWYLMVPPEHLFYYSPQALKKLCSKFHFKIVKIRYGGIPLCLGNANGVFHQNSFVSRLKKFTFKKLGLRSLVLGIIDKFHLGDEIEVYAFKQR